MLTNKQYATPLSAVAHFNFVRNSTRCAYVYVYYVHKCMFSMWTPQPVSSLEDVPDHKIASTVEVKQPATSVVLYAGWYVSSSVAVCVCLSEN